VSSDPILMGDKEALAFQRTGVKLQKYSETRENPKKYLVPKWNAQKTAVIPSYQVMTPAKAATYELDPTLPQGWLEQGVVEADPTAVRSYGFIKGDDGELEQMSLMEHLSLPDTDPRYGKPFVKGSDIKSYYDRKTQDIVLKTPDEVIGETWKNLKGETEDRYTTGEMMKNYTYDPVTGIFTQTTSPLAGIGRQDPRFIRQITIEARDALKDLDTGTIAIRNTINRVRDSAKAGLFGSVAAFEATLGGLVSSAKGVYQNYKEGLHEDKRNNNVSYSSLEADFADKYWGEMENWGWIKAARKANIDKGRLTAGVFTLALQGAKLLAEQKGRDISNADIERFMQMVGGNASSIYGFEVILNDLEDRILEHWKTMTDWYMDSQVPIGNPEGPDQPDVMNLSVPGEFFGGRYQKRLPEMEAWREELNTRRTNLGQMPGLNIAPSGQQAQQQSYSRFRAGVNEDESGIGRRVAVLEKTGEQIPWSLLAKQIYFRTLNEDPDVRNDMLKAYLDDAFPDTPDGDQQLDEFLAWYTSFK